MKQNNSAAMYFGYATLLMLVWFSVAAVYYVAELLSFSMQQIGMWLWLIAIIGSVIMILNVSKKWLEVWLVLKPSLLRITVFMWHLFIFLVTRNVVFNFVISILFVFYTVARIEKLKLKGEDIISEGNRIFKDNNNALYMTSVFYLWYAIRTTYVVEAIMYYTGLEYILAMAALMCIFMIAVFGFVRMQYVICVNIFEAKMK